MDQLQSNRIAKKWKITSLLLLVVIVCIVIGGYVYIKTIVADMTTKHDQLQTERDVLKKELATKEKAATAAKNKDTPTTPTTSSYTSVHGAVLSIATPLKSSTVTSPLTVNGTAPGNWFSEGQFTIKLLDANKVVLAAGPALMVGSDYTKPANFSGELKWEKPVTGEGTLVLEKSNPSGLASNADSAEVPVKF